MERNKGWCRIVRAAFVVVWLALGIGVGANAQSPISGATQVVGGDSHTCALVSGGVKCWGNNFVGQLGDDSNTDRLTAVDVAGLTRGVAAITAGFDHTCALTTVGGVKCWGNAGFSESGDNSDTNRRTAGDVPGLSSGVTAIAAGFRHTCALTTQGGVKCWGYNNFGQLGDNSTVDRLTPVEVSGLTGGVTAIAAGRFHTCAVIAGGAVKCWGDNGSGQLGDGSTAQRASPVDVAGMAGAAAISAGTYQSCALTTSGGVKCWGGGPLGDNSLNQHLTAVDVMGLASGVTAIAAGFTRTCALISGGGVKCWGLLAVGDSSIADRLTPVDVTGLASGAVAIMVGYSHACAVTSGGGVKCWGSNSKGQLGDNSNTRRQIAVDVAGMNNGVTAISVGYEHSCALTADGGVKCWGLNTYGQLGDSSTDGRLTPVSVTGMTSGVVSINAGTIHTCALTTGNGVKCWGNNEYGQLGDNSTLNRSVAVDVVGLTDGIRAIAAGGTFSCALTLGGGVKCWGTNYYGQLGDNSTAQRFVAGDVSGLTNGVTAISVGYAHACALTAGGGVKCWGQNQYGQLGDNSTMNRLTAVDVTGLASGVAAITVGAAHSCALTVGGGVKCWGSNSSGQLGDSFTNDRAMPADVVGLTNGVAAIAGGGAHSCALTTAGGVKCWGNNFSGQLGDNSRTERLTAVDAVGLTSGVTAIATGSGHTCALTTGGGAKCWGSNTFGEVGDGTVNEFSPFPVVALQVNTAPFAPLAIVGTSGDTQVSLAWAAPASDGGSAIVGYNVQVSTSFAGTYANVGSGTCAPATANASTATSCTVTGLTNGVTYYFKVAAINSLGLGSYSGASGGVTPMAAVVAPPPPVVPPLPVTVPGVNGTPSIVNIISTDGPAFLTAMTGMLNNALSSSLQFVEQTPQGTVVLRGYQGGSLAFMPHSYQTGDTRANGIYPLGDGRYQVVSNGTSLTIAPALRSLDQLVALLSGAQVMQGDNGVLTAYLGGVAYVVQPSIHVLSVSASGSARLLAGADGYYHFIDAQGNEQILYPAFREPGVLRAALLQIDPVANLLINFDGTATAQVFGRSWTLVPDLILVPVPGDRLGQAWWPETSARYRYANSQFQPVSGMSQGLRLR